LEVADGQLPLVCSEVGLATSMVRLDVVGLHLDGLVGVLDTPSIVLLPQVGHCAVAVSSGLTLVKYDRAGVGVDGFIVIFDAHVLVAYVASIFSAALVF
jgi:hypothetical protein